MTALFTVVMLYIYPLVMQEGAGTISSSSDSTAALSPLHDLERGIKPNGKIRHNPSQKGRNALGSRGVAHGERNSAGIA